MPVLDEARLHTYVPRRLREKSDLAKFNQLDPDALAAMAEEKEQEEEEEEVDAAGGDDNGIDVYSDYDDDDEEALLG